MPNPLPHSLFVAKHVLATPAFFLRWLSEHRPGEAVGVTRSERQDAIANFLRAYDLEVDVLEGGLRAEGRQIIAPVWVRIFTFQYDRRGWDVLTAERCVQVLHKHTLPCVERFYAERRGL